MAIQLDKILADIAKEKALHPNNAGATKQDQDDAWARIGRLNKLTVHESRSIFIVLQKKYEQEKLKGNSGWKLFGLMQKIHQEPKVVIKTEDEPLPIEEVEEYEMLEVQEPEDDEDCSASGTPPLYGQPTNSTGSASSDGDSPTKSNSTGGATPEKDDKPYSKPNVDTPRPAYEEKKLLNTMASNPQRSNSHASSSQATAVSVAAAALQKKGITLKKAPAAHKTTIQGASPQANPQHSNKAASAVRTTIQLPEAMKRKLSDECATSAVQKKIIKTQSSPKQAAAPQAELAANSTANTSSSACSTVVHTTTAQLLQVKKERESNQSPPPGINIITIPATSQQINGNLVGGGGGGGNSSTAATMASTSVASTNGFSPHLEELDFKNDIIFDSAKMNAGGGGGGVGGSHAPPEIINLGNYDNSLPPTFFKNLCNSTRHEALGLYVANVMNRISRRGAAKLELGILRAIVDVQSDELEQ